MKKNTKNVTRRLNLTSESLRILDHADLRQAAGGGVPAKTNEIGCTSYSCNPGDC